MPRNLLSSLRLSVLATLTGDAPHVINIWAIISIDIHAKSAAPDYDNRVRGQVSIFNISGSLVLLILRRKEKTIMSLEVM